MLVFKYIITWGRVFMWNIYLWRYKEKAPILELKAIDLVYFILFSHFHFIFYLFLN